LQELSVLVSGDSSRWGRGAVSRVITLTTDFGYGDSYVAAMKGVILGINPQAAIVDISHSIEPQNIAQAAYVLSTAWSYFPQGTIHVVIVDPGVGSARRAVVLETPKALFVSPDNGLLTLVMKDLCPPGDRPDSSEDERPLPSGARAVAITNPRYWNHPVSPTFHGRDIFAPIAAHLSLNTPIDEFGEVVDTLRLLPIPQLALGSKGETIGHVLHIDHFGNVITDIRRENLRSLDVVIEIGGRQVRGLSSCYTDRDDLLALVGSSDHLEIAYRCGSAAATIGAKVGDEVIVRSCADG